MDGFESCRTTVADIDELAVSMTRELTYYWSLGEARERGTKLCLIYKIPQHIREVDRNAYEPMVQSFGPYHYGTPTLQAMEKEKWNCLDYILNLNREKRLRDYLKVMQRLENQVRSCYTEEIKMDKKKFRQMLLLDGCFILVSLYGTAGIVMPETEAYGQANNQEFVGGNGVGQKVPWPRHEGEAANQNSIAEHDADYADQIGRWYTNFVAHDLLLLENQIPFFVVERIYELVAGKDTENQRLTDKIAEYVEEILHYYPKAIQEFERPKDFHHLLHLGHMYFRPSQRMEEDSHRHARPRFFQRLLHFGRSYSKLSHQLEENDQVFSLNHQTYCLQAAQQRWRRAAQYVEAGVEFKKREFNKQSPHSLLDIRFTKKVLEIPCLPIDENTSSLFRNFVALEQTCPQFGNDVTAYIVFMSQLTNMPDDVMLLAQRGIIVHELRSDEEVSTLFTKLSKDVVFDFNGKHYLKSVWQMMEAHYQSRLNRWIAWLRHNHFSNPWLALGAFAAVIVLSCTALQTLISVFSYVYPPMDE
ncbi:UPF0481 protein [Ananas comosus]|uniref:UPF0481 protein n=1 Tax=Ananas comosus TaxID=4615 RepID=A0A199UKB2_ANACO|nr:UPF0481 protein [Ananas comosus]